MTIENFHTTPVLTPHKLSEKDLNELVKSNPELNAMAAHAKSEVAKAIQKAVESDVAQNKENRKAQNLAEAGALSSIAVLRALGAIKN